MLRIYKSILGLLAVLCALFSAGCISPPRDLKPALINENELNVITNIENARRYAELGRLDLAEGYLRQALEKASTDYASLYNDLGYALAGQGRYREAINYYYKALELEPHNLSIQQNLARAFYGAQRFVEARRMLEAILVQHYDQSVITRSGEKPRELSLGEIIPLYRDLASVYWMLGYEDEASCYSSFAAFFDPTVQQIGQHTRTLMASGLFPLALQSLGARVKEDRERVEPSMLLDYALALAAVGNLNTAEQALAKLLAMPAASSRERRDGKIFLAVLSDMTSRSGLASSLLEEVIDENPDLCEDVVAAEPVHWPTQLVLERRRLLKEECRNGVEHSAKRSKEKFSTIL